MGNTLGADESETLGWELVVTLCLALGDKLGDCEGATLGSKTWLSARNFTWYSSIC